MNAEAASKEADWPSDFESWPICGVFKKQLKGSDKINYSIGSKTKHGKNLSHKVHISNEYNDSCQSESKSMAMRGSSVFPETLENRLGTIPSPLRA